jgi:serine/threonine protein kinase
MDMKMENILVDENGDVAISDFGSYYESTRIDYLYKTTMWY